MFIAIVDGDIEAVKYLIALNLNLDIHQTGVWTDKGFTPLIIAVESKETQIVKLLLEAGANPNLSEKDTGGTPLIYAAITGSLEIINLLLKFGADRNIRDNYNETALMKAEKFSNSAAVQFLSKYS
ncbi:MAG: ankyrin repeat domain-containing protein [Oscillatoria sp. PMC 1051.18]|nr:ankyrin repeat domain-containing protein [Oscillatoria sp. PMC 1051.18]